MSINLISHLEQELILKAQKSRCKNELRELSRNQFSNVRRCVAKNACTPISILKELAFDPVANVSYVASQNPLTKKLRKDMEIFDRCVTCTKDESTYILACANCERNKR